MEENNAGLTFGLTFDQVPEMPTTGNYADQLRWLLIVMDFDDPRIGFVAGCFSYCVANGGLTHRQILTLEKIIPRVLDAYQSGMLLCQSFPPGGEA